MKQRVITALILAPIALAAIASTNPWYLVTLLGVLTVIALPEEAALWPAQSWSTRTCFHLFYVLGPLALVGYLHVLASESLPVAWFWSPVLAVALPVWAGDTAAIFAGKAFGERKLAPSISPNKTLEGSLGHLAASIACLALLAAPLHLPMWQAVAMGAVSSIFAQAGDLFESWLKRRAGVKDSGSILPGHGGVLDRIDGILFAAIPVSLWLLWLRT